MTTSGFLRFWKRFFRNRSSATFIFNPYAATETTPDGKIKRQRPKVVSCEQGQRAVIVC